jgi:proteasome lid subunit RPN8/RPN11
LSPAAKRKKAKVVGHPSTDAKRPKALDLLLRGHTVTATALELGVRRETVSRWRSDPEFQEDLEAARSDLRDAVHDRLLHDSVEMVAVLHDVACGMVQVIFQGQPVTGADGKPVMRPREGGMARVAAVKAAAELLGWHKGKPARPSERKIDLETVEDLRALLLQVPPELLTETLEQIRQAREVG